MATVTSGEDEAPDLQVHVALQSDPGTEKGQNEDACVSHAEGPTHVLVVVADGVGGEEGGEVASRMAVDVTLRAYMESPLSWGPAKRLYRAAQQANIEIHDRALVVTELRRMATTLTAIVVDGGTLHAAHVGDSHLYLIRGGTISQKTKDHTVAANRQRMGLISAKRAKDHPERSTLTRSLGRELIVAVDRITFPLASDDILLVCTDGLYNVLDDEELRVGATGGTSAAACSALIETANERGTPDNLTVAVVHVTGSALGKPSETSWRGRLSRLLGR
jgi:serine/threonine protein phosphatase PrpC